MALAQDLVVAGSHTVDDWGHLSLGLVLLAGLLGDERPDAVQVHGRAVELLLCLVEVAHADLAEVARMVLVPVDAVVALATSVTATTRVLPVLADTAVTVRHVAAGLAGLLVLGAAHLDVYRCAYFSLSPH